MKKLFTFAEMIKVANKDKSMKMSIHWYDKNVNFDKRYSSYK